MHIDNSSPACKAAHRAFNNHISYKSLTLILKDARIGSTCATRSEGIAVALLLFLGVNLAWTFFSEPENEGYHKIIPALSLIGIH
jgi:hypothetical protein